MKKQTKKQQMAEKLAEDLSQTLLGVVRSISYKQCIEHECDNLQREAQIVGMQKMIHAVANSLTRYEAIEEGHPIMKDDEKFDWGKFMDTAIGRIAPQVTLLNARIGRYVVVINPKKDGAFVTEITDVSNRGIELDGAFFTLDATQKAGYAYEIFASLEGAKERSDSFNLKEVVS